MTTEIEFADMCQDAAKKRGIYMKALSRLRQAQMALQDASDLAAIAQAAYIEARERLDKPHLQDASLAASLASQHGFALGHTTAELEALRRGEL